MYYMYIHVSILASSYFIVQHLKYYIVHAAQEDPCSLNIKEKKKHIKDLSLYFTSGP